LNAKCAGQQFLLEFLWEKHFEEGRIGDEQWGEQLGHILNNGRLSLLKERLKDPGALGHKLLGVGLPGPPPIIVRKGRHDTLGPPRSPHILPQFPNAPDLSRLRLAIQGVEDRLELGWKMFGHREGQVFVGRVPGAGVQPRELGEDV
jgi:hypothetical protein